MKEGEEIFAASQAEYEPLDPAVVDVFENVIEKLRQKRGVQQPTKFQRILDMVISAGKLGVAVEEIAQIFDGNPDPERRAQKSIGSLNDKHLKDKGVVIGRGIRYSAYPLDREEK